MDKKWMIKSYVGKKILLIMEKTTVDFISEASSIYYCFSFLGCLWWCQMFTPSDLRQPAPKLPGIYCLWLSTSVVKLVTLYSAVRLKPHRVGQNPSWDCWCCFSSGYCCSEGSGLPEQDGCCYMEDDYSFSYLPKTSIPNPSSGVSGPLYSSFAGAPGKWLQMKICVLGL